MNQRIHDYQKMKDSKNEISLFEMRRLQMDMFKQVINICETHNLRYTLSGGSLLGAIRHKGYIPWDDDLDIILPRKDYIKFLQVAPRLLDENCTLISPYNNPDHIYTFSKIYDNRTVLQEPGHPPIGVYIDLFPMDGLPEDIRKSNRHFFKIKLYNTLINASIKPKVNSGGGWKTFLKFFLYIFCRPVGTRRWLNMLDKFVIKYDYETSRHVAIAVISFYGNRERVRKAAFSEYIKMPFEDMQVNIPVGYHEYLSNVFGDYMTPPPKEKQITHHSYKVWWK